MPRYFLTYLGGNPPETQEEGQRQMAKYREWLVGLGSAAVSPANPLIHTCTVQSDGSILYEGTTAMSGYTIVDAENREAALALAQSCPFLESGGMIEVSELVNLSG